MSNNLPGGSPPNSAVAKFDTEHGGTVNPPQTNIFGVPIPSTGVAPGGAVSPGGRYVWSDSILSVGPFSTGIHTRVLKDIAVVILALVLAIVGFMLMAKPDITSALRSAAKILPETMV